MIFNSIRSQLLFISTIPIVIIVFGVSLFFLIDSLENVDEDLNNRGQYLSEQFSLLSEFYFYTGNIEELTEIAQLAMKNEDIDFIRFSDNSYNELVQLKKENYKDSQIFNSPVFNNGANLDDFNTPISLEDNREVLGNITFGLSKSKINSKKNQIYKRMLLITLLAIFVGLFLEYIFSRKLLSGLRSLKLAASKIESKEFDQRCLENATGELLNIQKTFNNMANSIQKNEKILQGRIHFATKSLNDTIDTLSAKNIELDKTRQQTINLEKSKAIADERTRIMKDMHDGIGGQLVASLALIEKEENTEIRNNISEILSACLEDFRLIINSLNTSANILSSLLADFKYKISRRLESLDIALNWQVDEAIDSLTLQPQQALHILRILQEAFTNIFKHSNANQIRCVVRDIDDTIHISVEDNGKFSTAPDEHKGQGLKNIDWRAQNLGGHVSFNSSPTGGFQINLTIPKSEFITTKSD